VKRIRESLASEPICSTGIAHAGEIDNNTTANSRAGFFMTDTRLVLGIICVCRRFESLVLLTAPVNEAEFPKSKIFLQSTT
jgi:hypothetical protein